MEKGAFLSLLEKIPDLDAVYAVENIGGSELLYEKSLRQVNRLIPSNLEQMDSYYEGGDLGAFAVKAHGLKGSFGQVGDRRLSKLAEALEKAAKAGDWEYCREHYGAFREELLRFHEQVDAVFQSADMGDATQHENTREESIADYRDVLSRAWTAADEYDSMAASEILSPLTRRRFGKAADELISNAVTALDIFQAQKALEYISELLNECEK